MLESENIDPDKLSFASFTDWARINYGIKREDLYSVPLGDYKEMQAEYQKYLIEERAKPKAAKRFGRQPGDPVPAYDFIKRKPRENFQGRTFND